MSYFQIHRDPYPMTSPEAMALQESFHQRSSNNNNNNEGNAQEVPLFANDITNNNGGDGLLSSTSTTTTGVDGYYDCDDNDDEEYVPMEAIGWTDMVTTTKNRGPSEAAIARLRGGGGLEEDTSTLTGSNKNHKKGSFVDPSPVAVLDDADVAQDPNDDDDENNNDEDLFLDRPAYESRKHGWVGRCCIQFGRYMEYIVKRLYGDTLSIDEFVRTLTLASTLFFMIGGYWLMRSLKDPVITALCGVTVIPKAKIVSVFVVLGIVSIYNHLLDTDIPKHKLFYLFGTFYFVLFTFIGAMLFHPTYGLANEQPDPYRILGWISYCSIESFGSVMVTLFWSFANSNISLETAKASYGLMVATAQIGSIIGPTFVQIFVRIIGVPACYMIGSISMLLLQASMYVYITIYGTTPPTTTTTTIPSKSTTPLLVGAPKKKKEKAGILEGLKLLYYHNYVKGIFAISCLFMVEVTILDYTMKVLARDYFAIEYPCGSNENCYNPITGIHGLSQEALKEFASFMGLFGQSTNLLSFSLSLFGTSAVIRYLGLRLTLLLFPSLCLIVIIFVRMYPTLYVVFGAMMILKANSYALNNPTKEILYQPTSTAVKYKAKSWIDIFGDRVAKAVGSIVTNAFSSSTDSLIANGSLVGMVVATFLIWNARYMGRTFDEYTSTGYTVGGDNRQVLPSDNHNNNDGDNDGIILATHTALKQNDTTDTSCAIVDNEIQTKLEQEQVVNDLQVEGEGKDFAKKPDVVMV